MIKQMQHTPHFLLPPEQTEDCCKEMPVTKRAMVVQAGLLLPGGHVRILARAGNRRRRGREGGARGHRALHGRSRPGGAGRPVISSRGALGRGFWPPTLSAWDPCASVPVLGPDPEARGAAPTPAPHPHPCGSRGCSSPGPRPQRPLEPCSLAASGKRSLHTCEVGYPRDNVRDPPIVLKAQEFQGTLGVPVTDGIFPRVQPPGLMPQ
jgi:hypothetical protein